MIRHLAIALLATAALGGCATDYAYRGGAGAGDYYYGRPSVEYHDYGYGAPYGSAYGYPGGGWGGGLNIGYGYGGYGGYGYPYGYGGGYSYYPPYYWHRPHRPDRPPPVDGPRRVTGGNLPANMVRRDAPRSPVYALPRDGQRPMRPPPPSQRPWQGRGNMGNMGMGQARPPMSRPSRPAIGPSPGGRGNVVERRPDPRPAPPLIRQSQPSPPASSQEREPVRKQKR